MAKPDDHTPEQGTDPISQDDIDRLLQPGDPPKADTSRPPKTGEEGESYAVSQNDIDLLIELASGNADPPETSENHRPAAAEPAPTTPELDADDDPDDDSGLITQEDINALLESSLEAAAPAPTREPEAVEALQPQAEPEPETVSQEDIDALLNGAQDEAVTETADAQLPAEPEPEPETVSQEDIDALLNGAQDEAVTETADAQLPAEPEPEPETVSQEDIDALLNGAQDEADVGQAPEPAAEKPSPATDAPPAPGEYGIPQYVVQADIDRLLQQAAARQADEASSPEAGVPAGATDAPPEKQEEFISQEDIDLLLKAVDSEIEDLHPDGDDSNLITQEDIDLLLKDTSAEFEVSSEEALLDPSVEPFAETQQEFISQDEINRLLGGEEADSPADSPPAAAVPEPQPAVVEEVEEPPPAPRADAPSEKGAAKVLRFPHRQLWASVAACAVFLLATTAYFAYRHTRPETAARVQTYAITSPYPEPEEPPTEAAEPVIVICELADFVVPAPPAHPKAAYLTADVSITLTSHETAARVKANEPFFRKVIYDTLRDAISAPEQIEAGEDHLQQRLKEALEKALPQGLITRVRLKNMVVV